MLQKAILQCLTKNSIGGRYFMRAVRIFASITKPLLKHPEDNILRREKFDVHQGCLFK